MFKVEFSPRLVRLKDKGSFQSNKKNWLFRSWKFWSKAGDVNLNFDALR